MWKYSKKLQYPINIRNKNLKMAKAVMSQYGGAQGELGAALRIPTDFPWFETSIGRTPVVMDRAIVAVPSLVSVRTHSM